jgi:hypothetical protein
MIEVSQAVISLRPGIEWTMNGDDVEGIIWHTPNVEPLTTEEVQQEIIRLQEEQEAQIAAKKAAKQSAMQKLAALGLNEEEVSAIIGDIS